jgi:predicted DNA-binding transcriptional regulator YafY
MSSATQVRLKKLVELLMDAYPEGLTTPEIATHFGVTRQTAKNDIDRLGFEYHLIEVGPTPRYTIEPTAHLKNVRLSLAEAWFLYLPLRRIVRSQLHRYPFVAGLLRRITVLLRAELADHLFFEESAASPVEDRNFIQLTQAWHEEKYVEMRYQALNNPQLSHLVIAPWWFEPAIWTDGLYLIAGLHHSGQAITLKLDRIVSVRMIHESFQRPDPKAILDRLKDTWGIWAGEGMEVELHFSNRVYERLKETRWHPNQQVRVLEDGRVSWKAHVDEPKEMIPWIRSWGPDVEVIRPEHIRQELADDALTTARLYGHDASYSAKKPSFF